MKLIVNNPGQSLKSLANQAIEIKIVIAFLTEAGIGWLPDEKWSKSQFIIGINSQITSKECVKQLQEGGSDVNIFYDSKALFHPKAIYFKTEKGEYLFIGSHNLTGAAMERNYELSVLLKREKSTEEIFADFMAQFNSFLANENCYKPGKQFYDVYRTKRIQYKENEFDKAELGFDGKGKHNKTTLFPEKIDAISDFIKVIAEEFPKLERKRHQKIVKHPLKVDNTQYKPVIDRILKENVDSRISFFSQLNIGGNWYRIPNIFIEHSQREDWSNVGDRGLLRVQIHFDDKYQKVMISLVLLYEIDKADKSGTMPAAVFDRLKNIARTIGVDINSLPDHFLHWGYKNLSLWSKPIVSVRYNVADLPDEQKLYTELKKIVNLYLSAILAE